MVGKRKKQTSLFDAGNVFPVELASDSFHGQLAQVSNQLFSDEEFAGLYKENKGRPSVPPSQLALVLIMQTREGLSDAAAIEHTAYDLRWAVVLRREAGTPLCAKSTLQMFRAQLMIHPEIERFIQKSLEEARRQGLLKGQHLAAAVDTKPMLGRGAAEDTYNLLASGMRQLARAVAGSRGQLWEHFLAENGLSALAGPSIKGAADLDWSDEEARREFLQGLVVQARRLIEVADGGDPKVKEAATLLEQLILQDVEVKVDEDGTPLYSIKQGTAKGRMPSAKDPEQRHGRKSASKRFNGHKSSVAVEPETGLILATDILSGDEGDATRVTELVAQAETNSGCKIETTLGDCAYGGGATRREFEDAGRELIAKVPSDAGNGSYYPKSQFKIDLPVEGMALEHATVTCPGGKTAKYVSPQKDGGVTFYFNEACDGCELRQRCTASVHGRSVHVHAQEKLLQEARAFQATPEGRAVLRKRLAVENGLGRLAQLGIGQARYRGKQKSKFQLALAATVVNLRRVWNWAAARDTGNAVQSAVTAA